MVRLPIDWAWIKAFIFQQRLQFADAVLIDFGHRIHVQLTDRRGSCKRRHPPKAATTIRVAIINFFTSPSFRREPDPCAIALLLGVFDDVHGDCFGHNWRIVRYMPMVTQQKLQFMLAQRKRNDRLSLSRPKMQMFRSLGMGWFNGGSPTSIRRWW